MRIDGYTRALLTTIALALAVIAVRPLLVPLPSYAAKKIEYKLVDLSDRAGRPVPEPQFESRLNQLGNDGWDIAAVVNISGVIMKR